jgi:hypothetical protein
MDPCVLPLCIPAWRSTVRCGLRVKNTTTSSFLTGVFYELAWGKGGEGEGGGAYTSRHPRVAL